MNLRYIAIVATVVSILCIVKNAFNNAQRSPAGYSGAPGEQTCTASGCHTGVAQQESPYLNFSFFPPQNPRPHFYTPNTAYVFTVNFPIPPQPAVAGFLVTAIDQNNNSAGRFEIISTSSTDTLSDNNRKYISHKNATSTSAWVFRWVAPPLYVGTITFYCAALAGDGNNQSTNDVTYIDTIQFLPGGGSNVLQANFTISDTVVCRGEAVTFSNTSTGTIISHTWHFGANAIPPTATTAGPHNVTYGTPGTKVIKLVVSDGINTDSITKIITVNAIPLVNAGTDRTICSGQSVTLTATGASSYVWSHGSTTASVMVSPISTTIYSVTGTSNGCSATDDVLVIVNQSPVVSLPPTVTLCQGNIIVLNAGNPGASFLWSNQATTPSITVSNAGIYSVTVTALNGCTATSTTVVDVITSLHVNLPPIIQLCDGHSVTLDAGIPAASYQWSNGANTPTITVSAPNMYSVTVIDAYGCTGTAATQVVVRPNPILNLANTTICNGDVVSLDAQNAGSSYLWSNQATTQTISVSPQDDTTYSVTVTNSFGCTATATATITVQGIRARDIVVCRGDSATLTALGGSNYLWSNGATTPTIKVLVLDTTYFILSGTVTGLCGSIDTVYVYPVASTVPLFTGLPDTFCSNAPPILLEHYVTPIGGTFSGTGIQNNILYPENVLPGGPFNIHYSYTNSFGCTAQVTRQFSVILAATVSLNGLRATYCTNDAVVVLSGIPAGGHFFGPGTAGHLFVPYFAGPGRHVIGYRYTAANGCISIDWDTISVYETPQLSFYMPDQTFCDNEEAVILEATPSGGTFSGTGVDNNSFNPRLAGAGGPYLIQYSYTDSNGCMAEANSVVHIYPSPQLSFVDLQPAYCLNDGIVELHAMPSGGTFWGNSISNNQFFPLAAGIGHHTIRYYFTNQYQCSDTIEAVVAIYDQPEVSFYALKESYCTNDVPVVLTGIPAGGVFSGIGIEGNVFNPAQLSPGGPYTISYNYIDANGCEGTASARVFINLAPEVSISALSSHFCPEDNPVALSVSPEGGILTGAGIANGFFNPSNAGVGTHLIRYEFLSANGCFGYADLDLTVNSCNNVLSHEKNMYNIYPNPFSDRLVITWQHKTKYPLAIKLIDMLGKELFSAITSSDSSESVYLIHTYSLPSGIYQLRLIDLENQLQFAVIKE